MRRVKSPHEVVQTLVCGHPDNPGPIDIEEAKRLIDMCNSPEIDWPIPDDYTPEMFMEYWNRLVEGD